jgi:hypothetical protein
MVVPVEVGHDVTTALYKAGLIAKDERGNRKRVAEVCANFWRNWARSYC